MHKRANHQGPRLWLIAGTGEGLALAQALRRRGWRLVVSVVSPEAALAYPGDPELSLQVGPIGGAAGIRHRLDQAQGEGDPYAAVVDASHPFARQITAALVEVWEGPGLLRLPPLLRLHRPEASEVVVHRLRLLPDLEALADLPLTGCRLLMAIGARQLGLAVQLSPGALHHARLLPSPAALQQGRAAGLAPERLACLRPGDSQELAVLRALLRRWRIETILCRQSGGITERLWRQLAAELNLELLLLARPPEAGALRQLGLAALIEALEALQPAHTFDASH